MGIRTVLILFLIVLFTGYACSGRLYSNTVRPYTTNFDNTPIGSKVCILRDHTVQVNRVSAEWVTEHFADALRTAGIKKVYYAELKTFIILFGLYQRKTLIIYGD
ncbi:MAG: hypothetical protein JW932_04715 [Deltaproteobacteria bacterium]|nr:hypothetical protein [Deltaproteobacteria bacterium]